MHGDIKPHNITFDNEKYYLIDFSNTVNFFELAE